MTRFRHLVGLASFFDRSLFSLLSFSCLMWFDVIGGGGAYNHFVLFTFIAFC